MPLDGTFESNPPLLNGQTDLLPWDWQLVLNLSDDVTRDLGVRPWMDQGPTHLDIVGHSQYASHVFCCILRVPRLPHASDEAGQRNHAILHRHRDIGISKIWVPP